ncbi:TetR/AcrR family transcriptional regulator [Marininema halotolerans]|uniref:DNA-binding transcriptional regulator, AcrR family n=1 Tax=Marininema halotolerans TaxID=1155944 RepID=A0A1I6SVI4_9BACL|nr:TetR/AcrR family transcriptional regulator [Marininema halotolerans]SFS80863.1 DNA-binding transcriptional regulator, AcrR family [Marininema halotolerans]
MEEKEWKDWVHWVAEEYGLDLSKERVTEKQRRILEAAIHIFSEKGFEGASTSSIAKKAGVAEATIFKHYKTKKGLLLHLVIPALSRVVVPFILKPVVKILDTDKPLGEIIPELYEDRMKLVEQNWRKIQIILVESLYQPEIREAVQNHVATIIYEEVVERVDAWQKKGLIREDLPAYVVARSILSMGLGFIVTKNILPDKAVQEDQKTELSWTTEALLHGIAGPLEKKETL